MGDPRSDVMDACRPKVAVRAFYNHTNEALARPWIDELVISMFDKDCPEEIQSLSHTVQSGRTRSWLATPPKPPMLTSQFHKNEANQLGQDELVALRASR